MGLILVETLNDLDAFHRKEASFFVRSPLLCEKSFSSSGIIPNFCLGSQPSEIPLTLQPFNFQLIEAPYIVFHYHLFFSTHALFFFLCFPSLSLSLFFFFSKYSYKKGFSCFNLLLYPPAHTSLGILGTAGFIRMTWALRRTRSLWVTSRKSTFNGLWHISSMIHCCWKDYYMPLTRLRWCAYFSTCCITR